MGEDAELLKIMAKLGKKKFLWGLHQGIWGGAVMTDEAGEVSSGWNWSGLVCLDIVL